MFTTGFNVVDIDYMAFCRATKSAVLYAQSLGRGARITPYAANCLVSDFGGNIQRHGTLDAVMAAPGRMLECEAVGTYRPDPVHKNGKPGSTAKHVRSAKRFIAVRQSVRTATNVLTRIFHGMRCPNCGQAAI